MMNPSNRRERRDRPDNAPAVRAGEFSALEGFLAAYLHEDFREEHATPDDALAEFLEDATSDDVSRLAQDWRLFQARVAPLVEGNVRVGITSDGNFLQILKGKLLHLIDLRTT